MRKRVLYLHGLESSNTGSKVDFLHEVSDCFAPAMDYKDIHVEKHLMKMVQAFKPDVINPLITKEILDTSFIECVIEEVEGMGHRIPLINFEYIYNKYIA